MAAVLPVCLSMLVCDAVALDTFQGKPSILGVTHVIRCSRFPVLSPRLAVYVELTSGRGEVELEFTALVSASDSTVLIPAASDQRVLKFVDPLDVVVAGTHVGQLLLRGPGEIVVRLIARGSVMIERRVRILLDRPARSQP